MAPVSIAAVAPRPPRAAASMLVLGSAAAVLVTGLVATVAIVSRHRGASLSLGYGFWAGLVAVSGLTAVNLGLRALRWIYLLRRCETRLPIRDAYIGYLAGFSLVLAPLLLGEIAVRSYVLKERGEVSPLTTAVVNVWERVLDLVAVAILVGAFAVVRGHAALAAWCLVPALIATAFSTVRITVLRLMVFVLRRLWPDGGPASLDRWARLTRTSTWHASLAASLIVWLLSGTALWLLLAAAGTGVGFLSAIALHSRATLEGAVQLAPAGVVVTGGWLVDGLGDLGVAASVAAAVTLGARLATVGLATALGVVFLVIHRRGRGPARDDHFDAIADSYDVQIPEARRQALLERKTTMMCEVLHANSGGASDPRGSRHLAGAVGPVGPVGLDIGCGQGWYVRRMREQGFKVTGIDSSAGQVALSGHHLGHLGLVQTGSVLEIPYADDSLDFAYSINVLHHLPSVAHQRRAFSEIMRVLRPGGLLFLHEINTRNVVFRFYMGYVFPSLNCIDEGVERWLLPDHLDTYTSARVVETRYFTFLPEFTPETLVRLLAPLERRLERSPCSVYSAHYMAVLRKDT